MWKAPPYFIRNVEKIDPGRVFAHRGIIGRIWRLIIPLAEIFTQLASCALCLAIKAYGTRSKVHITTGTTEQARHGTVY